MSNWTLEQLKNWIDAAFPDNVARLITEADLRDVLKRTAEWVQETNSSEFIGDSIAQAQAFAEQAIAEKIQIIGLKSEIVAERVAAQQAKADAQVLVDNAALGQDPKGEYNATTNIPALTATPDAGFSVGAFYTVTVAGNVGFAGSNFASGAALAVGGRLIKKNSTHWFYAPPSDLALSLTLASKTTVDDVKLAIRTTEIDSEFVVTDEEGNVIFRVHKDGVEYIGKISHEVIDAATDAIKEIIDLEEGSFKITDQEGNVAFSVSTNGEVNYPGKGASGSSGTAKPVGNYDSQYLQVVILGQSLSVGGSFSQAIDFSGIKTFQGGILTNYNPDTTGAADAYYGGNLVDMPGTGTETQGKGLAKTLKQLIDTENGLPIAEQDFTLVVNAPGAGGLSYSQIANTTGIYYRRTIESIRRAKDFALASGKSFSVGCIAYIQGENSNDKDDTIEEFYTKLETLFESLNTDIKTITGQVQDVQFINYQIASFPNNPPATTGVPLAQLKLAQDKENVHFGGATYQMQYTDGVHIDSNSTRILGAMMGVVAKRALVDRAKMEPIFPKNWIIQQNEAGTLWAIVMKMQVPVVPLVIDESIAGLFQTPPAHKGFSILNGAENEIITAVTLAHGDTVNILCSENPSGRTLTYAIGGRSSGGYLRDSQGDAVQISCAGVMKRVDNWTPIFSITI